MKRFKQMLTLAGAICALLAAQAAQAAPNKVLIGDIDDMSGPYADILGAGGHRGDQDGDRRFRRHGPGPADRTSHRRSPEQARHRPAEVQGMGRHGRADHAARRLQLRRQPRFERSRQGKAHPVLRHRGRRRLADRQGLHALHDPLRIRHDGARQRHGQDDPRTGRQELVLSHRGLRLRHATRERSGERREGGRRQRRRRRAGAARAPPISLPISCRRKDPARRCSVSPTPAPTRSIR